MDERAMSTVTVVVCPGDRRALFEKCVESLLNQTLARDHYEILIVGSESSDDTRLYAEKISNTDNRVAYLHGKWTTRSEARNAGLVRTGTRCVAFLGEETIPDVNWLENLLQPFLSDRKTMIVGGELSPEWGSDRPVWLKDRWLRFYSVCLNWSAELRLLEQGEWLSYENICFDTDVLKQLGGFPVMHKTPSEERHPLLQRTFAQTLGDVGFALLCTAARLHTQKVSAFMLYERLKAERKISKDMLYRQFDRMVGEGYLHTVAKFGYPRATKKLYLCDIALKNALVFQKHFGRLFENMVLTELVKHHDSVFYEEQIDFYLPDTNRVILCMPFGTKEILFKKIEQAEAFIVTHGVTRVEVITMSSESSLHHPFVDAEMIPFAQWALSEGE